MAKFNYTATLEMACELFTVEPLLSAAPQLGKMVITSKDFPTEEECIDTATGLLSSIATLLEQITGRSQVVVSKINPMYNGEDPYDMAKEESWFKSTASRLYIADAELLKKENRLHFTVSANISTGRP
jgi:hypothetical protein